MDGTSSLNSTNPDENGIIPNHSRYVEEVSTEKHWLMIKTETAHYDFIFNITEILFVAASKCHSLQLT